MRLNCVFTVCDVPRRLGVRAWAVYVEVQRVDVNRALVGGHAAECVFFGVGEPECVGGVFCVELDWVREVDAVGKVDFCGEAGGFVDDLFFGKLQIEISEKNIFLKLVIFDFLKFIL